MTEQPMEYLKQIPKNARIMEKTRVEYLQQINNSPQMSKSEPDITITCRSNQSILHDIGQAMGTLIPTKYRFPEHEMENGIHILKYRRTAEQNTNIK